jgi:hypothetical protein
MPASMVTVSSRLIWQIGAGAGGRDLEAMMPSNFAQARELLEHAWLQLSGDDETSVKTRQALDLLIEAVAKAEYTRPPAEIIEFTRTAQSRTSGGRTP